MSVINTNITSLIAQQNLSKSQSSLTTAMQRLSSGSRINSAKDDAAGQAIANRMSSAITGLTQAQRNANDGISVAQTAEGALNQINDNLQRIRELSVQSQNGTNSRDDLASIQSEITQRLGEINRISSQTDFNGVKVLAADQKLSIQVGANDQQNIDISLKAVTANTLGLGNFTVSGDKTATVADMVSSFGATGYSKYDAKIDGVASTNIQVDLSTGKVTSGATTQLYVSQTTKTLTTSATNQDATGAADSAQSVKFASQFAGKNQGDTVAIGGATWKRETAGSDANGNGVYSATIEGKTVQVTIANSTAAAGTGATLAVSSGSLYMDSTTFAAATTKFTTYATNEKATEVSLTDAGGLKTGADLTIGSNTYSADAGGVIKVTTAASSDLGKVIYVKDAGKASQSLITEDKATQPSRNPLSKLDAALKMVDSLRSDLGAIQNRFDSAITNLSTTTTNLSAARSRIQDADYSVEVANMTKAQILQQAGTSVLAQANKTPQSVLSLLQ